MQSPLLLSCKLTHAALKYLERRGEDLEPLYERFDWPLHYLRDSSSWLEADRLEYVLATLEEFYGSRIQAETGQSFFEAVGYASPQLRAWGALDSVLRIVPGVRELYHQPDRFLGSFISPQPMIQGLLHSTSGATEKTVFRIDFSDDRMPRTARYLRAALEALPEYIGKPRSHVDWKHGNISIEWSERQVPFVQHGSGADVETPSLSPELLRTILMDLANTQREHESAQRELEAIRRTVAAKDAEITRLQDALLLSPEHDGPDAADAIGARVGAAESRRVKMALHEIYKLGDYFARAQQIVTLLRSPTNRGSGSQLVSSSANALIRRTAWDRVSKEAPLAIRKAAGILQGEVLPDEVDAASLGSELAAEIDGGETANRTSKTPSFFDPPEQST